MRVMTLTLLGILLAPVGVIAGEDSVAPVTNPLVKSECGACHMAYPPAFLPAAAWRRIMADLDNHFGEDASLGDGERVRIESYLAANAGPGRGDREKMPLRITRMNWFVHEHSEGEVKALRQRRKVKTMADCSACHRDAEQGRYEDD